MAKYRVYVIEEAPEVEPEPGELIDFEQARTRANERNPAVAAVSVQGVKACTIDQLMSRLCVEPDLLADFRRDPCATALRCGICLSPEVLQSMLALERDAVTDVVLDREVESS